jgi:hypothetical protein
LRTDAAGQLPLDIHVDVFKLSLELESTGFDVRTDLAQTGNDLLPFFLGDQSRRFERGGMGDRSFDVVTPEAPVEADRFTVTKKKIGGGCGEAAVPHEMMMLDA